MWILNAIYPIYIYIKYLYKIKLLDYCRLKKKKCFSLDHLLSTDRSSPPLSSLIRLFFPNEVFTLRLFIPCELSVELQMDY